MNLYISDMHLGHKNVIRFDKRPFYDIEEHDRFLMMNWNNRVQKDDDVWIVGDLTYKSSHTPDWYLKKLRGRKHLIVGNHDNETLKCEEALKYLDSVDYMLRISDEGKSIHMCHYPLAEWEGFFREGWHVYGHIHNNTNEAYRYINKFERALNAGCMINNYAPVSFSELIENNRRSKESVEIRGLQ